MEKRKDKGRQFMDAAAVKKLQTRYYRKAVGATGFALVGYSLLSLYLQWFCLRLGAFCWTVLQLFSGAVEEEAFWLGYRYTVEELQGSGLYFALSQFVLIPVVMVVAGWKCRRDAGAVPGLLTGKVDRRRLWTGGVTALLFYSFCQLFTSFWGMMFGQNGLPVADIPTVRWPLGNPWLTLLLTVLISPVVEEYLFRGALLSRLRPYGDSFAIAASAVLFAFMHNSLPQLFLGLGIGTVLGWLAVRTGSLRTGILLHMLVNLLDWGRLLLLDLAPGINGWLPLFWVAVLAVCCGILLRAFRQGRLRLDFEPAAISVEHPWVRFFFHPAVLAVMGYCFYRLIAGL